MSFLRRYGPYALALAVLVLVALRLDLRPADVASMLRASPGSALAAFACFLVQAHLAASGYRSLLLAAGEPVPGGLRLAYATSVLAKYLPGGIWQVAGRVALLGRLGVSRSAALAASLVEQVFAVLCCLAFALAAEAAARIEDRIAGAAYGLAIVACGLLACIASARLATGLWNRMRRAETMPAAWRFTDLVRAVAWLAGALVSFGAGYLLLIDAAVTSPGGEGTLERAAAVYFGTFAGLAVVLVPGGLGVREGVAASLSHDGPAIMAAMLVGRLLIVASELAYFSLARAASR